MTDWLKNNLWGLIIAAVTLSSTYVLYGYRITALENRVSMIEAHESKLDDTAVQTQITLAKIQTDIEYIKEQLSRALPPL